jgi:hypothetical protein
MTEAEWLACGNPREMLESFLRGPVFIPKLGRFTSVRVSCRKLRLFAAACYRRIWHLLTQEYSRKAVEVAEQLAEGRAGHGEVFPLLVATSRDNTFQARLGESAILADAFTAACSGSSETVVAAAMNDRQAMWTVRDIEWTAQAALLQDIFGPLPFRPVRSDLAWLTPDVVTLAGHIYHDRAFDRMPELADALEDIGCDNADLLSHLRGPGPHVRGCWVVDLLLGKE